MKNVLTTAAVAAMASSAFGSVNIAGDAFDITINSGTAKEVSWRVPQSMLQNGGGAATFDASEGFNTDNEFISSGFRDVDGDGTLEAVLDFMDPSGASADPQLTIWGLSLRYENNPLIELDFNAIGGVTTQTVSVTSGLLTFAPGFTAGSAVANVQLIDNVTFGDDGATFTPIAGVAYNAQVDGATFADLLTNTESTLTATSFSDSSGLLGISPTATTAQTSLNFTITPFDVAIVTTDFDIVPAPGSVALLGVGGLVAIRRRR